MNLEMCLQRVFSLGGDAVTCPRQAAKALGLSKSCVARWARSGFSSFGFPLRVQSAGPFHEAMVDVRDINILMRVLAAYPLTATGPVPRNRASEMLALAQRLKAAEMAPR